MRLSIQALALIALCVSLGGIGLTPRPASAEVQSPVTTYLCTAELPLLRIMPLGDSITESSEQFSSYRLTLWRELRTAGCKVNFVGSRRGVSVGHRDQPSVAPANPNFDQDHEGHWGYRVDQILTHLAKWLKKASPDIVLIHLGSNDVFQKQSIRSTTRELTSVVELIHLHNPRAITIIAQLIPSSRQARSIQNLNRQITEIARRKDSPTHPVIVVNMHKDFSISKELQPDGVHPNDAGDRKIGTRFASALLKTLTQNQ